MNLPARLIAAAAIVFTSMSAAQASPPHADPHATPHEKPAAPAAAHAPAATLAPTPDEALAMLKAGNARFVAGTASHPHTDAPRRAQQATDGQTPFVSVLTCSDSRVPAELLFDAGFGDLFVIRVAGNIACTTEIGTLEYGAGHLHTPLIVVMGHTKCGAVTAAVTNADVHGSIPSLVEHIKPAVATVREATGGMPEAKFIQAVIRANVNEAIKETLQRSDAMRALAAAGKVKLVGAVYDIESGKVEWTGEHPQLAALLGGAPTGELVEDVGGAGHATGNANPPKSPPRPAAGKVAAAH